MASPRGEARPSLSTIFWRAGACGGTARSTWTAALGHTYGGARRARLVRDRSLTTPFSNAQGDQGHQLRGPVETITSDIRLDDEFRVSCSRTRA
jgi:hypothetical protein